MLATVYGDVHDIGKSLVNTILVEQRLHRVRPRQAGAGEHDHRQGASRSDADAIGLSALLVSTSKQMPLCVQELDRRGLNIPGADRRRGDQPPLRPARAVRRGRARVRPGRLLLQGCVRGAGDDGPPPGRATARRRSSRSSLDDARNDVFLHTTVGKDIAAGHGRRRSAATSAPTTRFRRRRSSARGRSTTFRSTKSSRCSTSTSCIACSGAVVARARSTSATVREEFEPTLARLTGGREVRRLARSRAPCTALPRAVEGNDLVVYDPTAYAERRRRLREIARFHFPRQDGRERLCIADYFRSVGLGRRRCRRLPDRDRRRRGDASASRRCSEPANTRRRSTSTVSRWRRPKRSPSGCIGGFGTSLGLPGGQGKRYSWGYGACPDLEDHATAVQASAGRATRSACSSRARSS